MAKGLKRMGNITQQPLLSQTMLLRHEFISNNTSPGVPAQGLSSNTPRCPNLAACTTGPAYLLGHSLGWQKVRHQLDGLCLVTRRSLFSENPLAEMRPVRFHSNPETCSEDASVLKAKQATINGFFYSARVGRRYCLQSGHPVFKSLDSSPM